MFLCDLLWALDPANFVDARRSCGWPAFSENEKQFARGDKVLAAQEAKLAELRAKI